MLSYTPLQNLPQLRAITHVRNHSSFVPVCRGRRGRSHTGRHHSDQDRIVSSIYFIKSEEFCIDLQLHIMPTGQVEPNHDSKINKWPQHQRSCQNQNKVYCPVCSQIQRICFGIWCMKKRQK